MSLFDKYFSNYNYSNIPEDIINFNNQKINEGNLAVYIERVDMNEVIDFHNQNYGKIDNINNMNILELIEYYRTTKKYSEITSIYNKISIKNYHEFDKLIAELLKDNMTNENNNNKDNVKELIEKGFIVFIEGLTFIPGIIDGVILFLNHIKEKFNMNIKFNYNKQMIKNLLNSIKNVNCEDNDKEILFGNKIKVIIYSFIKLYEYNMIDENNIILFIDEYIYNIEEYINEYNFIGYNTFSHTVNIFLTGFENNQIKNTIKQETHKNIMNIFYNHNNYNNIKELYITLNKLQNQKHYFLRQLILLFNNNNPKNNDK